MWKLSFSDGLGRASSDSFSDISKSCYSFIWTPTVGFGHHRSCFFRLFLRSCFEVDWQYCSLALFLSTCNPHNTGSDFVSQHTTPLCDSDDHDHGYSTHCLSPMKKSASYCDHYGMYNLLLTFVAPVNFISY